MLLEEWGRGEVNGKRKVNSSPNVIAFKGYK